MRNFSVCMVLIAAVFLFGCEDPKERANAEFSRAIKLLQSAEKETDPENKLVLLENADAALQQIIEEYPSTDLAVKLDAGEAIGQISVASVKQLLLEVVRARFEREAARCFSAPSRKCLWVQAVATAKEIRISSRPLLRRAQALSLIAGAQAEAGDVEQARETIAEMLAMAKEISHATDHARALQYVARAQAQAGDVKGALATAKEIRDDLFGGSLRTPALRDIASVQAKAGDVKEALATAKEISIAFWRAMALSDIASNLPE